MAKITGKVSLIKDPQRGWVLVLVNPGQIKADAVEKFVRGSDTIQSISLDMELKAPHVGKTLSQLGYLHAAVWPEFYKYYETQGQPAQSQEQKEAVRDDIKFAIGFVENRINLIYGADTQNVKSFSSATKDETTQAIDDIIRLGAEFGIIIPGPQEYLERHGVEDFV